MIAGIGGVLPDIDIIAFWGLYFFGYGFDEVHRTFLHTLFMPLLFLIFSLIFHKMKIKELGKHKLRISTIFLFLAFGSFTHLFLDSIINGQIMPFYPISSFSIGLNLIGYLPSPLNNLIIPTLEGILLVIWMIYLEIKHKISDYI